MSKQERIILIKGEDKTQQIKTLDDIGSKIKIVFHNDPKTYFYNKKNVKIIHSTLTNLDAKSCFNYLKDIAQAIGLLTPEGENILSQHYSRIDFIREDSILSSYLTSTFNPVSDAVPLAIFPFGFNTSQKAAVEKALTYSQSVIQGPPGTGKTQTILNIIANAIMQGKTVAVVSNNNTATANIQEKLEKHGISFISAYLGNTQNKQNFINAQEQKTIPADLASWKLSEPEKLLLQNQLSRLFTNLAEMLKYKNKLAELQQQKRDLETEYHHFCQYFHERHPENILFTGLSEKLSTSDLLDFLISYEHSCSLPSFLWFFFRIYYRIKFGLKWGNSRQSYSDTILDTVQKQHYVKKSNNLKTDIQEIENILGNYNFEEKMNEYSALSLRLLKGKLAAKYSAQSRPVYQLETLWQKSASFLKDYPVILSTTYSLRSSLSSRIIYDYVIIDEASQVDIATGALALSCAQKAVVVGDSKQLPNVVDFSTKQKTDAIFVKYHLPEAYRYSTHSFLQSILNLFPEIPQTMLKEHYRCHPKIIGFCNEKFYDNQLLIFSKDTYTRPPLVLYKTVPGNHARGHLNLRQIEVIKSEVFPKEKLESTSETIGIVTPYREQTKALQQAFAHTSVQADTVDKFQGREKDIIIISTVDNQISDFTDQPNRLNVAVSRAKKQLIVVTNGNQNNKAGYVQDLMDYIEYHSAGATNSKVHSVFDWLYQQYQEERERLLHGNRVSPYDSENLMYQLLVKILQQKEFQKYQFRMHVPLRNIIKDFSILTPEEAQYAKRSWTHVDFLIFNKLNKKPRAIIEVDGFRYHFFNFRQQKRDSIKDRILTKYSFPFLRFKTNDSNEKEKIINMLRNLH